MRHEAERGRVLAGELVEARAHGRALLRDAHHVGGRVLHAGDVLQLEQPLHGVDRHVDHRARRDVVDDDRNADGVVDRLEVLVKPFLRRLVVVGRDHQHGIGAGLFGVLRELDRLVGRVRAGAGDHRHPALRLLDAPFDDLPCSSWESVGLSPVVPTGTSPLVPSAICQSTRPRKAFSSTEPFLNGVTSAVNEPRKLVLAVMTGSSMWFPAGRAGRRGPDALTINIGSQRYLKELCRRLGGDHAPLLP